ncbi:unnamed protein product [Rotaria socialis]|uniref:Uncharacterized protein n=1 Tax=Rotaria socialis TaxID=392032 RepID=A0A821SQC8_9BILA|nr:unnamed protein product [Rotaria socialis]CAF3510883.1 unnamed protein product [Rotaria socialis]CAF4491745.1 unnamed protein product [Rotaria socialis]CAF4860234.1 unnamed protein product [Rotaria socialis]
MFALRETTINHPTALEVQHPSGCTFETEIYDNGVKKIGADWALIYSGLPGTGGGMFANKTFANGEVSPNVLAKVQGTFANWRRSYTWAKSPFFGIGIVLESALIYFRIVSESAACFLGSYRNRQV